MRHELQCPPETGGEKPRSQAPLSVGVSGETLADLPEGEETFSVILGPLLVILLDRPRLPLLCGSQHSRTADLFRETNSSKDTKNCTKLPAPGPTAGKPDRCLYLPRHRTIVIQASPLIFRNNQKEISEVSKTQ